MPCPFLREVFMAYCGAYPIRKLVPRDRVSGMSRCTCDDYRTCPLFAEVMGRLRVADGASPAPGAAAAGPEEVPK